MAKFEIGNDEFQARKLDAFDQLKIVKRLVAPLTKMLSGDMFKAFRERDEAQEGEPGDEGEPSDEGTSQFFQAFASAAAAIPDADLEFIIKKCCSAVERKHEGVWAPILITGLSGQPDIFAFPDLQKDPGKLLRISYEVIRENLTGFFAALPSNWGLGETLDQLSASSQTSPTKPTG